MILVKKTRINRQRFKKLFDGQAVIGKTTQGGLNRPAFSHNHILVRRWLTDIAEESNLECKTDQAGNHFFTLPSLSPDAMTILIGSHMDSVTNGGRFDGALGVIAGLEVLLTIRDQKIDLPYNLTVVDFSDEEGNWLGLLGSRAFTGLLTEEEVRTPRGGYENLTKALAEIELAPENLLEAKADLSKVAAYFELHIEQGKRLEKAGLEIGVVDNIVGVCSYMLQFTGRADHAGTIGMDERLDAGRGAARFILEAKDLVVDKFKPGVVNVGQIEFKPGSFNIVPSEAVFALEFRATEQQQFDDIETALLALAERIAKEEGLGFEAELRGKHAPAPMANEIIEVFETSANQLGQGSMRLASFAGHDAQSLAKFVPSGMIFVPSIGGASHSPREFTDWQDCVNGANALLHGVLAYCKR